MLTSLRMKHGDEPPSAAVLSVTGVVRVPVGKTRLTNQRSSAFSQISQESPNSGGESSDALLAKRTVAQLIERLMRIIPPP